MSSQASSSINSCKKQTRQIKSSTDCAIQIKVAILKVNNSAESFKFFIGKTIILMEIKIELTLKKSIKYMDPSPFHKLIT